MGILNNDYNEWGEQGDRTPSYKLNGKAYVPTVKTAKFKDFGLNVAPNVGRMAYARKDVVITLKNIQDGINKDFPGKGYGFVITDGARSYKPKKAGHYNLVGVDIKPTGGMKWEQLVNSVKKHGKGFDGNIHKNLDPSNLPKAKAGYGLISPKAADNPVASKFNNYHNNHLDLKYNSPYDPDKSLLVPSGGGGGGGSSLTGGAASLDQYFDQLKHDPSVTGMHYDPSKMTEGQQSEYLKNYFRDSSTTEGQQFENLKDVFGSKSTFQMGVEHNEFLGGYGAGDNLLSTGKSFYDPITEQINLDPTQRVLFESVNTTEQKLGFASQPPVASRPFNRELSFTTPNLESLKKVLYGGVKFGVEYAKGYLRDRSRDLIFGKKLSRMMGKADSIRSYASLFKGLAKTFAKSTWNAASKAVQAFANAAWQSIAQTAVGQAIGGFVSMVGAQLAAMWGALTALPFIGGAIAAVGAAVSWLAGAALAFLFPW